MTCGIPEGSTLGPLLFLFDINDQPNCSNNLIFRIFADDTNLFASLEKVKEWCDVNKLSINLSKTNYMIILKSSRKTSENIKMKLQSMDGSCHLLNKNDHIKYVGVTIDKSLSWKYHIFYICSRVSRNIGIISKLIHYLSKFMTETNLL